MYSPRIKDTLSNLIILSPLLWVYTGLFYSNSGKKQIGVFMLASIITILIKFKWTTITLNFKHNKILWLLFISMAYSLSLFIIRDFDSSRIRALTFSFIFLVFLPKELLTKKLLYILLFFGALFIFCYSIWFTFIELQGRNWPLNVIPFSTFAANVSLFSFLLFFYESKNKFKIALIMSFLLPVFAILIGQSRGVWLAFVIIIVIILILLAYNRKLNKKIVILIPCIFLVVGFSTYPKLEQRIQETVNEFNQIKSGDYTGSIGLRLKMWIGAIELSKISPIIGLGDDHTKEFNRLYKNDLDKDMAAMKTYTPYHYHMEILNTLVKLGFIGLLLFSMPILYIFWYFLHKQNLGSILLLSMATIYLISGLTDIPLSHGYHIVFFWIMLFYLTNNKEFDEPLTKGTPIKY